MLKDQVNFAIYADRFRLAPYGLFGGTDGQRARCEVVRGGKIIPIKSKDGMELRKGDILTLYTAGGGGFGPVAERDPNAVLRDVRQGYLTAETARRVYGVSA